MPAHRRRPTPPGQPPRRPRVAGLRKPGVTPSPTPRADAEPKPESKAEESAQAQTPETSVAEHEPAVEEADDDPREPDVADDGQEDVADDGQESVADSSGDATRGDKPMFVGGLAVGVVFVLLAGFLGFQYFGAKSVTDNEALADAVGTAQVKEEISRAVESLFSYSYQEIDEHEEQARQILIGEQAQSKFDELYADVREKAPEQQLIVNTTVEDIAVISLTDDRAELLMFLVQTGTRGDDDEGRSEGPAHLKVDAQRVDDRWRISDMETYGEPSPAEGPGEDEQGSDDGE